ncbi:hypothetical protein [Anditalea andensis]|uniref:DUF2116 family Zn-ribbon domain-containing protein n=1 Tax=Anditalea andensis TaxID=1048983 RepID=A0A074L060_9BACT|nr:hypothetical protein [Anditalea andensis]KEO74559.1 hypothetical protein EL17_02475 [Anditalea andensis]
METKLCLKCKKPLKGRSDKKFCDDLCRNSFNNQAKASSNNYVRNISNALRKNRSILEGFLHDQKTLKVTRENMIDKGFQFKYHTDIFINKNRTSYYFCFEYGYLELDNDMYLIVRRND